MDWGVHESLNEGRDSLSQGWFIIRALGWVAQTEYGGRGRMLGFTEGFGECGGPHAEAWDERILLHTGI